MYRSSMLKWQYFRNLITLFLNEYNHNENSFVSELWKKDVGSSHRVMLSRNKCSSNPILDFDNELMKDTKNVCKFLEDTSKGVWFYKAAALQPIYLLKRTLLPKKVLMVILKFFCKKKTSAIFS